MTTKSFINRTRWLHSAICTLIFLFTLGVGNAWGTDYFSDNFSSATGNSNMSSRTGWTSLTQCYAHYGSAVRLGTGSAIGSITKSAMPAIGSTPTTIVLRFSAKKWNTDAVGLNITVNNAGTANITNITLPSKQATTNAAISWNEKDYYEIIITGATSSTTITFTTSASKRILLGNVSISSASDDTYRFKLVENAKDIGAGDYLIVYNNTNALNNHYGNVDANTYATYTDISSHYTAGTKSFAYNSTTEALVYKAYTTANGYALRKAYSGEFLGYASASTGAYLRWDNTFTTTNDEWDLGVNSIVACYNSKTNAIRWNNTSGQYRFAIYGKTAQSAVQLFKKEVVPAATVNVTGVSVSPTSKSIVPGETFTITPTISPADATDKSVSWTSGSTSYATVNSSGVVTGVAAGSSTITCKTNDGNFTATCAVTVRAVTLQARDEDGNAIAGGGPGVPTRSGATITAAANAGNYVFKQWDVTNATVAASGTTPTTISNPTGAVTVTAVYYKPITITYKANGSTFTTQTYARGGTLAFPNSNPDGATYSCTGKTFVGWVGEANKDYSDASTPPTYATAGGSVTAAATYYAVFADVAESTTKFKRMADLSELNTATKIAFINSYSSSRYILNTSFGVAATTPTESDGEITVSDGQYWTLEKSNSNWKFKTGTDYLVASTIPTSDSKTGAVGKAASGNTEWVITPNTYTSNGTPVFTVYSAASSTAGLEYNNGWLVYYGTDFNTSWYTIRIYVPKKTYSAYATSCCTPLGSINGSFLLT